MLLGGYTYTVPKKVSERESSAKLNNVRIGMAKAEVQSILGAPDSTSAQANAEYMVCYLELPDHVDTDLGDRPYIVRLVNGKVESFGRFAELLDLYDRPVTGTLPGQSDLPQAADSPETLRCRPRPSSGLAAKLSKPTWRPSSKRSGRSRTKKC